MRWFIMLVTVMLVAGCVGARSEMRMAKVSDGSMDYSDPFVLGAATTSPFASSAAFSSEDSPFAAPPAQGATRAAQKGAMAQIVQADDGKRKLVYRATLGLRVANRRQSIETIETLIENYGGYIENASLEMITFRVAPEKFDAALSELETLGEVTLRNVNVQDVTDQYTDVELRLEVAETSRQRLMDLLEKATEVKDLLEIERDMRRLTEEIERMKGQMKALQDRIQWATITITLQERVVDTGGTWRSNNALFPWMREIGVQIVMRESEWNWKVRRDKRSGSKFKFATSEDTALPEDFALLLRNRESMLGASVEGYRLSAQLLESETRKGVEYWAEALKTDFEERLGYDVTAIEEMELKDYELAGRVLRSEAAYGGERWAYTVWIIQDQDDKEDLLVVEYARLLKDADLYLAEVAEAVKGVEF